MRSSPSSSLLFAASSLGSSIPQRRLTSARLATSTKMSQPAPPNPGGAASSSSSSEPAVQRRDDQGHDGVQGKAPTTTSSAVADLSTDAKREPSSGPSRPPKSISHTAQQSSSSQSGARSVPPSGPSNRSRPLNGLFGLIKPSGPTSMALLESLKPLFAASSLFRNDDGSVPESVLASQMSRKGRKANAGRAKGAPKIGQGGTLDPLADGVLVVGVGSGTKKLGGFLECTKEYRTTALLGSATTSYDSQEPVLFRAPFSHVGRSDVEEALPAFRGPQKQLPPLFSAIRIDGKRLFEYARNNEPLPRPVEARGVTIDQLELVEWLEPGEHGWKAPDKEVEEEEKSLINKVRELAGLDPKRGDVVGDGSAKATARSEATAEPEPEGEAKSSSPPPAFTLRMTVSSGTYVRSVVHDVGQALGSAAHVVVLTRTRQGEFFMGATGGGGDGEAEGDVEKGEGARQGNCIPWSAFEKGIRELEGKLEQGETDSKDDDGLREWERLLLKYIRPC